MILIIDNYDSFTYNLLDYFYQLGQKCILVKNDATVDEINTIDFNAIVISPGPGTPNSAGNLFAIIEQYHQSVPILGICLGHQALGVYYGATLDKARKPMHGKISRVYCESESIFNNLPNNFNVVRYHSLIVKNPPECLQILSETDEKEIMAFRHRSYPSIGIQFHPEAILTENGIEILKNWLLAYKITR